MVSWTLPQLLLMKRGELDAAAGVSGGWWRGQMAGSDGEASTRKPLVVLTQKDSLEQAPSGQGFTDDTVDDSPVGLERSSPVWASGAVAMGLKGSLLHSRPANSPNSGSHAQQSNLIMCVNLEH